MIPETYRPLFQRLVSRTQDGEINWSRSAKQNTLVVSLSEFSITLTYDFDESDGEEFVAIRLINDEGRDADGFWISKSEPEWNAAFELYGDARRKADRIDVTLESIMEELSKPGPVGEAPVADDDDLPF